MAPRNVVVLLPRLTKRLRRPVAPGKTRSVSRQRERGNRFAKLMLTPVPETLSRLVEQPERSLTVRRMIRSGNDCPVLVVRAVDAAVVGVVGCCPSSPDVSSTVQFGGVPV